VLEAADVAQRDVEKLTEALRLCRLELASLQQRQEVLLEERNLARRRASAGRRRARALSEALVRQLASQDGPGARQRSAAVARALRPGRGMSREEVRQLRLITSSPLFDAAWYLRQNLDVVESGASPALHFLRVGGSEGRRPGPRFNTTTYLANHPEVRATGTNPLVHFLTERAKRRAS
jgi:hypothetical protein